MGQDTKSNALKPFSPPPWSYEYSPYNTIEARSNRSDPTGTEIPAYTVFDADGRKVFDSNEDTPWPLQEANARLGAAAPAILSALEQCVTLLADYDRSDGEEGDLYWLCLKTVCKARGFVEPSDERGQK